ncbi:MAG: type I 3-dehydroquinate dehydratase, partial [Bacteroidales bacterium]|nr:type I 3-dehydroquinate dehydratase [Bacteroidales bacterium]
IAALSLGSEFTFASLVGGKQTAPGQLTRQAMEQILAVLGINIELKQPQ